jgi:hypothetical protein
MAIPFLKQLSLGSLVGKVSERVDVVGIDSIWHWSLRVETSPRGDVWSIEVFQVEICLGCQNHPNRFVNMR